MQNRHEHGHDLVGDAQRHGHDTNGHTARYEKEYGEIDPFKIISIQQLEDRGKSEQNNRTKRIVTGNPMDGFCHEGRQRQHGKGKSFIFGAADRAQIFQVLFGAEPEPADVFRQLPASEEMQNGKGHYGVQELEKSVFHEITDPGIAHPDIFDRFQGDYADVVREVAGTGDLSADESAQDDGAGRF